ncbi:MAG: HEAT repeat domain-containing protein [Anaerolineae bacterium]
MSDNNLEHLIQVLKTGEEEDREEAALALGRLGAAAIAPLAALLAEDQTSLRWWAARTLAEVGGDEGVRLLLHTLEDGDPDVRACAALALGQIGDGQAAPALARRLGDESAFVAGIAADALSMIGEAAVEAVTEKLDHPSSLVRLLAVRALNRIRSSRSIPSLCRALEDPSYLVRHYAQETLEALVGMEFFAP